jgi:hypothetical protein
MQANPDICESCACGCEIISTACLEKVDGRICNIDLDKSPEIRNAVDLLILEGVKNNCGCIGSNCFNLLCEAIKTSRLKANEYNKQNPGENKSAEYFLEYKWKKLVNNRYFKIMYASYVMYYFYALGHACAKETPDGAVTVNTVNNEFTNKGTRQLSRKEADLKATSILAIAKANLYAFETKFLDNNRSLYPCLPTDNCCKVCLKIQCGCQERCVGKPRARGI